MNSFLILPDLAIFRINKQSQLQNVNWYPISILKVISLKSK